MDKKDELLYQMFHEFEKEHPSDLFTEQVLGKLIPDTEKASNQKLVLWPFKYVFAIVFISIFIISFIFPDVRYNFKVDIAIYFQNYLDKILSFVNFQYILNQNTLIWVLPIAISFLLLLDKLYTEKKRYHF